MKKIKVVTVVGTRPEIIRLSRVMSALDEAMEQVIVHTGQNFDYELNEIFYRDLSLRKPDYFLDAAGRSFAETVGQVIMKIDPILAKEKPDALLVLGDTNSCLAVIPAKRRKIPVFHMEAGNRCFDQRVPEELNRRIVDHLSDINLTYTEHARRYLLAEGLKPDTVIKTGSPMKEVLLHYMPKIQRSTILEQLKITSGNYFVVSAHREENIESEQNFSDLLTTLNLLAEKYKKPVIVSTHPRTRKKLESVSRRTFRKEIRFLKPLGFSDYVKLQLNAFCVISDSGTITEEASILNIPAITIRQAHERPEGMDEGTLIMSGLKSERVWQSVEIITSQYSQKNIFKVIPDHDIDNVSLKVTRIIASYIDYVNRTVWYRF